MGGKRWGVAALSGAAVVAILIGGAGQARSAGTFTALAAADGIRTTISDPGVIPTGATLGLSGPTAQALVDSLGNSRAFASLPDPGDFVVSAPGLARGQGASGVPDYPAYAASNAQGQPAADVDAPGYGLHAKSDAAASSATASGGGGSAAASAGSSVSTAAVTTTGGRITSKAESTTEAFEVAGVLRIGRVHAAAAASNGAAPTSELQVGDVTVAGQSVGLTDKGLTVGGTSTPLPDSSPVRALLDQAGITVRYLAPQPKDGGIQSGGVEVDVVRHDSGGTLQTVYTLGRAEAVASGHVDPDASTAPVGGDDEASFASGTTAAPVATDTAAPFATAPAASMKATPTVRPAVPARFRGAPVQSFSAAALYLVLFLAAGTCLGGVQLIRYLGVKLAWK